MKAQEGQRVLAQVEEVISNQHLIVSLDGRLLRVTNDSQKKFAVGDKIDLVVIRKVPMELQLFEAYKKNFDRFV